MPQNFLRRRSLGDSAINRQERSADPGREVGGEEQRGSGDIPRARHALEGRFLGKHVQNRLSIRPTLGVAGVDPRQQRIGCDGPGGNRVDPDSIGAHVERGRAGKSEHGELRCGVERLARMGLVCVQRGHDNGRTGTRTREGWREALESQRDSRHVDPECRFPFREVQRGSPAPRRHDAGVGDNDVDSVEAGGDFRHGPFHVRGEEVAGGLLPGGGEAGLREGLLPVNDGGLRACLVKAVRDRAAEPPAAAGDDCAAACEEGASSWAVRCFVFGHRFAPVDDHTGQLDTAIIAKVRAREAR